MNTFNLKVHSCRGDTVVEVKLKPDEAKLVSILAKLTQQESQSECEPTLHLEEKKTYKPEN